MILIHQNQFNIAVAIIIVILVKMPFHHHHHRKQSRFESLLAKVIARSPKPTVVTGTLSVVTAQPVVTTHSIQPVVTGRWRRHPTPNLTRS